MTKILNSIISVFKLNPKKQSQRKEKRIKSGFQRDHGKSGVLNHLLHKLKTSVLSTASWCVLAFDLGQCEGRSMTSPRSMSAAKTCYVEKMHLGSSPGNFPPESKGV